MAQHGMALREGAVKERVGLVCGVGLFVSFGYY